MKKNTLKKAASVFLGVAMAASLAACGSGSAAQTTAAAAQTAAPAETAAPAAAPAESKAPAETQAPAAETPAAKTSFKVGICNYVDDASLNQIVENVRGRLTEIEQEKGVTFEVSYDNCNADANVLQQIISNFIDELLTACIGTENNGFIINPWGESFLLTADLIQMILKKEGSENE